MLSMLFMRNSMVTTLSVCPVTVSGLSSLTEYGSAIMVNRLSPTFALLCTMACMVILPACWGVYVIVTLRVPPPAMVTFATEQLNAALSNVSP